MSDDIEYQRAAIAALREGYDAGYGVQDIAVKTGYSLDMLRHFTRIIRAGGWFHRQYRASPKKPKMIGERVKWFVA